MGMMGLMRETWEGDAHGMVMGRAELLGMGMENAWALEGGYGCMGLGVWGVTWDVN